MPWNDYFFSWRCFNFFFGIVVEVSLITMLWVVGQFPLVHLIRWAPKLLLVEVLTKLFVLQWLGLRTCYCLSLLLNTLNCPSVLVTSFERKLLKGFFNDVTFCGVIATSCGSSMFPRRSFASHYFDFLFTQFLFCCRWLRVCR